MGEHALLRSGFQCKLATPHQPQPDNITMVKQAPGTHDALQEGLHFTKPESPVHCRYLYRATRAKAVK